MNEWSASSTIAMKMLFIWISVLAGCPLHIQSFPSTRLCCILPASFVDTCYAPVSSVTQHLLALRLIGQTGEIGDWSDWCLPLYKWDVIIVEISSYLEMECQLMPLNHAYLCSYITITDVMISVWMSSSQHMKVTDFVWTTRWALLGRRRGQWSLVDLSSLDIYDTDQFEKLFI